ncbi:hypothetical protein [Laspinema palackyanum]|uniref:hypothetical protein n=1 Tax=Laspinema palackyanum TaxID=3231601 RepID=UPI00349F5684
MSFSGILSFAIGWSITVGGDTYLVGSTGDRLLEGEVLRWGNFTQANWKEEAAGLHPRG